MTKFKKVLSIPLIIALFFSMFALSGSLEAVHATGKGKINKTKISLTAGKTTKLKITNAKGKITWSTSNKKIATVSKKGKVKSKRAGKATITAKVNNQKFKCKVTVYAKGKISKSNLTLATGKTSQLKVTKVKAKIKWSTSNSKIATVSQKGKVTAKKVGKVTITAKVNKQKLTCKVTVSATNVPKFLGYKVESYYRKKKKTVSPYNLNQVISTFYGVRSEEKPSDEISDSMLINRNEIVLTTLVLKNEKRDNIIEIILDDSDYGVNRVYTSSSSINKIVSIDTVYNGNEATYYTYVSILLPKSKSISNRTINMKEITYLRNSSQEGKCFMGDAITKKLNMEVSAQPLPSCPLYFNFSKNETGNYSLTSLNYNYDIPEILYIPPTYNDIPVTKTSGLCFENASMVVHLIIPESIISLEGSMMGGNMSSPPTTLKSVTLLAKTPPYLGGLFRGNPTSYKPIYVPEEGYDLYNDEYGIDKTYVYGS